MWTAVVVTCKTTAETEVIQREFEVLKNKKLIVDNAVTLAVEDPASNVGSGSATVNALLVTAEHLSAKSNYQVVTAEVLADAHVIIFHHGRHYVTDPCGKEFLAIPTQRGNENVAFSTGIHTNLLYLLDFITQLAKGSPPGVWVCSTDMILKGKRSSVNWNETVGDAFIVCTKETPSYASHHGVVVHDECGQIRNIVYRGTSTEIESACDFGGKVPVVAGIVFLSYAVVEVLLTMHSLAPIDSCTYVGTDSGAPPLQASLYFDILIAMAKDTTQELFTQGNLSKAYDAKNKYLIHRCQIANARKLLWNELHRFTLKAIILNEVQHCYLDEDSNLGLLKYMETLHDMKTDNVFHSYLENSMTNDSLIINSTLKNVIVGAKSVIQHCQLSGTEESMLIIGDKCFVSGVKLIQNEECLVSVSDETAIIKFSVTGLSDFQEKKSVHVIFSVKDSLQKTFEQSKSRNVAWEHAFRQKQVAADDIWPETEHNRNTLLTAKLHPLEEEVSLEDLLRPSSEKWLKSRRYSIKQLLAHGSCADGISARRTLYAEITAMKIKFIIQKSLETSMLNFFLCAIAEGWENDLLEQLDQIASSFDGDNWDPGRAARTLACVADLISCVAGKEGGLRSGPASNAQWKDAFLTLERGMVGSIKEGVGLLGVVRDEWMRKHALWQMRAARHYEGAAQVLIRHAVSTANKFIFTSASQMPAMGTWVTAECPARVDLQGGWTDTPPICYELGGSVVNIALLINNKRPIGAKVRRIETPELKFQLGLDSEISFRVDVKNLDELKNYQHLSSPGALLKAAVVCAGIVDLDSEMSLHEQLLDAYSGGLEIQSWSVLPQGSGLGTSSILAGAVLAALWSATGKNYDKLSIIHAVLCIEQMLTTGGGWQDQVGGIMGGINRPYSEPKLPLQVHVEPATLSSELASLLNRHMLLIYTGKVRLAKNLLQNVIRNWYARDDKTVKLFRDLINYSHKCIEAVREGNLEQVGKLLNVYWNHKVNIAPGCDPTFVRNLMKYLQPYSWGQSLAGAGGGGFLFLLTKKPNEQNRIAELLSSSEFSNSVHVYPASVDTHGIVVQCDDWEFPLTFQ